MKDIEKIKKWIKDHKFELIMAGTTVAGTIIIAKNWDSIKKLFIDKHIGIPSDIKVVLKEEKKTKTLVPKIILDNLSGNRMTATKLGNKVLCSPQAINKRIVEAGLAIKLPCGEYQLTEAGRLVGEDTLKVTAYGHTFSNIEWDEKILEIIFSSEELLDIESKKEIIKEALGDFAA